MTYEEILEEIKKYLDNHEGRYFPLSITDFIEKLKDEFHYELQKAAHPEDYRYKGD